MTEALIGDLATGGAGLVGSILNGIFSSNAVKSQNKTNLQIARETNQNQINLMRENNAFNKQSAIDMFNLEANYNSPYNQVQRLREAGLNPAVLMEGNTSSTSGNTNGSTPSASATPSLYAPTAQAVPSVLSGLFQNMESVAKIIETVSKSNLERSQKVDILSKLKPTIENMQSETAKNQAQTHLTNVQTTLAEISKNFAVRKEALLLAELVSNIALNSAKGNEAEANAQLRKMEKVLTDTKNSILTQQAPYLVQEVQESVKLIKEQQQTEETKQEENRASALEHRAGAEEKYESAETTRQTREAIVKRVGHLAKIAEHEEAIKDVESRLSVETFQEQFESILTDLEISKAQKDLLREQFERARIDNDWAEVHHIMQTVGDVYGVARPAPTKPRAAGKRERSSYHDGTKYKWTEYLYE